MNTQTTDVIADDETEFKPAKKSTIYKKLHLFNEKTVRKVMNSVISKNRQCSLKHAGDQRVLFGKEVKLVLEEFS